MGYEALTGRDVLLSLYVVAKDGNGKRRKGERQEVKLWKSDQHERDGVEGDTSTPSRGTDRLSAALSSLGKSSNVLAFHSFLSPPVHSRTSIGSQSACKQHMLRLALLGAPIPRGTVVGQECSAGCFG